MGLWKPRGYGDHPFTIGPCKDEVSNKEGNFLQLAPCFKLTNENYDYENFPDIDLPEFPRIGDSTATHKDRTRVISGYNQKTSIEVFDLLYVSDHPAIYGWIEEEN